MPSLSGPPSEGPGAALSRLSGQNGEPINKQQPEQQLSTLLREMAEHLARAQRLVASRAAWEEEEHQHDSGKGANKGIAVAADAEEAGRTTGSPVVAQEGAPQQLTVRVHLDRQSPSHAEENVDSPRSQHDDTKVSGQSTSDFDRDSGGGEPRAVSSLVGHNGSAPPASFSEHDRHSTTSFQTGEELSHTRAHQVRPMVTINKDDLTGKAHIRQKFNDQLEKKWGDKPLCLRCLWRIERSATFSRLGSTVLVAYAIFLAFLYNDEARSSEHEASRPLRLAEATFIGFFTGEVGLKILIQQWLYFTSSGWFSNIFDALIVALGLMELVLDAIVEKESLPNVASLRVLRIFRLFRVLRIVRVAVLFRELRVMLAAVRQSLKTFCWTVILLGVILYVAALQIVDTTSRWRMDDDLEPKEREVLELYWSSVEDAFLTMYQCLTNGLEWRDPAEPFKNLSVFFYVAFMLALAFVSFNILNIMVGIFVDTALKAASDDDMELAQGIFEETTLLAALHNLSSRSASGARGMLTWAEFAPYLDDPLLESSLDRLGLTLSDVRLFWKVLTHNSNLKEIDVDNFVSGCMRLKGVAKALDLQHLMYDVKELAKHQAVLHQDIKKVKAKLRDGTGSSSVPMATLVQ